jgi:hypothetical protein
MIKLTLQKILNFLVDKKFYYILSIIFLLQIREKKPNGKNKLFHSKKGSRVTVLALDSEKYRGDLEALSLSSGLQILCIRQKWYGALMRALYKTNMPRSVNDREYISRSDPLLIDQIQGFMVKFLRILYRILEIDIVTNVNYRYPEDYDWTLASEKINTPYIMLYRECLINTERLKFRVLGRHKEQPLFHGSKIIVHNYICKSLFVESGYCSESKISVCGAVRMDNFIKMINNINLSNKTKKSKKKFILFYYPYSMSLFGKENYDDGVFHYVSNIWDKRKESFRQLHLSIIKMANDNPEIDYIIKPKREAVENKSWEFYQQIVLESKINVSRLNNYSVQPDANVHQLIFESDVVCGLQSSTVLESAIAGKRVVFPLFNDYKNIENFQDFGWKDNLDIFDVAENVDEFESIVNNCFINPTVSDDIQKQRKKLFNKYFDNLEGNAKDCYIDNILSVVED